MADLFKFPVRKAVQDKLLEWRSAPAAFPCRDHSIGYTPAQYDKLLRQSGQSCSWYCHCPLPPAQYCNGWYHRLPAHSHPQHPLRFQTPESCQKDAWRHFLLSITSISYPASLNAAARQAPNLPQPATSTFWFLNWFLVNIVNTSYLFLPTPIVTGCI